MSKLKLLLESPEGQATKVILAGIIDIVGLQDEIEQGADFIELKAEDVAELQKYIDDAVALQPDLNEQLAAAVALIVLFANKSGSQKFMSIASKLEQIYETYTGEKGDIGKLIEGIGIVLQGEKRSIRKLRDTSNDEALPEDKAPISGNVGQEIKFPSDENTDGRV